MTQALSRTIASSIDTPASRRGSRLAPRWSRYLYRLLALVVLLALWQLSSGLLGINTVPPPAQVFTALIDLAGQPAFWAALRDTVASTLIGLILAALLAIPLGLFVGASKFLDASSRLPVDFLRTIPAVTLIPLVVLIYGPTLTMKVVLIVFGAFFPLFVQATYAVKELDPVARDVARAYRLRTRVIWALVMLPSSAPFLVTGLRVATTMALLLSIGAELIGNAPGIGREIALSQMGNQAPTAYAYIIVAALLGVVINLVASWAQDKLLFWHPSVRGKVA